MRDLPPPDLDAIGHNMVNFGPMNTVPEKFKDRTFYQHNPTVRLMRTTVEENANSASRCGRGCRRDLFFAGLRRCRWL